MLKTILCFFLIISFYTASISQEIEARLTADTNHLLIGEPVRLNLTVKSPNDYKINFPLFADTLGNFEIVELYEIDTIHSESGYYQLSKNIDITSFDEGTFIVPGIILTYEISSESDLRLIETESISLSYYTVEVDTSGTDIKDIKPPIEIPLSLEDLLPYFATILGVFAVYYAIIIIFGKKRTKQLNQIPKYDPKIPADLEALEALQRLEKENLWQTGHYKLYYSKLTDIIRIYVHRRYHLNAFEMTSGELIEELGRYESNQIALVDMNDILSISDLAKFAKYEPEQEENIASMKKAVQFINLTKVIELGADDTENKISGSGR